MAIFLGLRRDAAARFAFLLGIPAILAAGSREAFAVAGQGLVPGEGGLFLVGMICSGAVGYLTVKYLLRYLASHSLDAFAFYRLAVAAAAFVWMVRR
jgi:undecaprenyl-diphosphatase